MKNKIKYLPIGILTITTALSGVCLSSARVAADTSGSATAAVTVAGSSCAVTSSTSYSATLLVYAGNVTESDTSRAPYTINCNVPGGFVIQAIGSSPDAAHPTGLDGNTAMYGSVGTIQTGTAGPSSYWSFRIGFAYATSGGATIATGYNTYSDVPDTPLNVISYNSSTSDTVVGLFRPDYQVYVAPTQAAGSYSGIVKYTLVPNA